MKTNHVQLILKEDKTKINKILKRCKNPLIGLVDWLVGLVHGVPPMKGIKHFSIEIEIPGVSLSEKKNSSSK